MFFIQAGGTPYEIGHQTGEATKFAVVCAVDMLARQFHDWDSARFKKARDRHMSYTEKACPDVVEEVAGLADGAGQPFELMYLTNFYASMRAGHEGCSNLILTGTPDGPVLAKTTDLPAHEGKHSAVRLIRPKDGPATLSMTWVGTVWQGTGINEAGLAIGGSSCTAQVPMPEEALNPHAIGSYVLRRAETVDEAIKLLGGMAVLPWGANHALVDRSGSAAIVEKAGAFQGVRHAQGARIWCTNHSLTPELEPYRTGDPTAVQESVDRFEAIARLSGEQEPSLELAHRVLAYADRPGAVCRYIDGDPVGYATEAVCLYMPVGGRMRFCFSHPDRDPWYEASLCDDSEPKRLHIDPQTGGEPPSPPQANKGCD